MWRRSVHLPRKGLRKDKKEKEERAPHGAQSDEIFDSNDRRARNSSVRPRKGRWMTKYAIWGRVSVTTVFRFNEVEIFTFASTNSSVSCQHEAIG